MNTAIVKPAWSPLTIALMVLGFFVFWPLGMAVLAYILWGEYFGGSQDRAERWISKQKQWVSGSRNGRRHGCHGSRGDSSGNAAFDAYRDEQLKRLDEERRRLDEEIGAFQDYMRNLRMARDREEFDRYMRERKESRYQSGDQGGRETPPAY